MKLLSMLIVFSVLSCSNMKEDQVSVLERIKRDNILLVATTGDYPPFSFYNKKTAKYEGTDIDLAKALASKLGVKLKIVKTSWPTLMEDYQQNKFDIALSGISKTKERMKIALFSNGYVKYGKAPITRCENKKKFKSLKDIDKEGVKLIVNPGGTNDKFARSNIKNAQIILFEDNTSIFQEIIKGNADVMITDSVEVEHQVNLNKELCATTNKTFTRSEIAALLIHDIEWKKYIDSFLSENR